MPKIFLIILLTSASLWAQITVPPVTAEYPHIFMSQEDIDIMKARVAAQEQPWYECWQKLEVVVDAEVLLQPSPYTGLDAGTFYDRCRSDSERALRLAIAYNITDNKQYAIAALNAMYQWAMQTNSTVSQIYTVTIDDIYNINTSMLLARSTIQFIFAYDLLYNSFDTLNFSSSMQQTVKDWYALIAQRMYEGIDVWYDNDYFNKQEYQNHLVAHVMGLISIGYLLEDQAMLQFAIDSEENPKDLVELMAGSIFMAGDDPCPRELAYNPPPTQTGEIYDRYRHFTAPRKGLQYAHLTLTLLTVCAEMTTKNGLDFFEYTAPGGENLELAFDFYSSFYWLKDARVRGGMYANENDRISLAGDTRAIFEMGHRYYPDNRKINDVLVASDRTDIDASTSDGLLWLLGIPLLTHGQPLLAEPVNEILGNWQMEQTVIVDSEGKQKVSVADSLGSDKNMIFGRTEQYGGDSPDFLPQLESYNGSNMLAFDGNDTAFVPALCSDYHDMYISFDVSFNSIADQQTILYSTSLFELRMVPSVDQTVARIQFIIYSDQAPVEFAYSPYSIVAGDVYHVEAWRKNEIAGVWADGETDIYGYSPSELTTTDSNLYLASIYKFDRRFLNGKLDNLYLAYDRYELICGDWGYLDTDVNNDCYVGIEDFATLASHWLACTNELYPECYPVN